jgi:malate dehydrogenase (oxaloacetate-decarboxylating)
LLDRYRDRLCTFNDDIQGTATVALAAVLSGLRQTDRRLSDQPVVIVGAGSAGSGIAEQIIAAMIAEGASENDARARLHMVDRAGLLVEDQDDLLGFQEPLAQKRSAVADWKLAESSTISLLDVIHNAQPSVLIGVTGMPGLFDENVVKAMTAASKRPIIMPLSNPTSRAEAIAPDVVAWTDGKALVATGSPFLPVTHNGVTYTIAQSNNSYIFPGIGLGVRAVMARRVTDEMMMAAAHALADQVDAQHLGDSLLPPLANIRAVSRSIAKAVGTAAIEQGQADPLSAEELEDAIEATMWQPEYRPIVT